MSIAADLRNVLARSAAALPGAVGLRAALAGLEEALAAGDAEEYALRLLCRLEDVPGPPGPPPAPPPPEPEPEPVLTPEPSLPESSDPAETS